MLREGTVFSKEGWQRIQPALRAGGQVFICGDQGKVGDFEDEIGCFIDMCALWG